MANHPADDPSLVEKNIAIACRTAVIALLAWIVVRATWPTELFATRLADLTFGQLFFGILWLLLSLGLAAMLFAYMVRVPPRKRQFSFWCGFWLYTGAILALAYLFAWYVLMSPTPKHGMWANIVFSISAFMWSLVL
jgi:hypothetical protein